MPEEDKRNDELNTLDQEPSTGNSTNLNGFEPVRPGRDLQPLSPESDLTPEPLSERSDTQSTVAPVPTPAVQAQDVPEDEPLLKPGPGILVLQWLTYAFWGWTLLVTSWLLYLGLQSVLGDSSFLSYFGNGVAYLLAAVVVLFIISLVSDLFYSRAEKLHARSTGTNVIMIIHAVLFSLFGIGHLIVSVFGVVRLMIGDLDDAEVPLVTILGGVITAVLYGFTLLRTLRPKWLKRAVVTHWAIMTIAVIGTIILAVTGPVAQNRLHSADVQVENNLPLVADAINMYVSENSKLPTDLSSLSTLRAGDYSDEAKKLVNDNKVQYTPGEKLATREADRYAIGTFDDSQLGGTVEVAYTYKLCVNYKSDKSGSYDGDAYVPEGQRYATTVDTYNHKSGNVCYDLQASNL